MRKKSNRKNIDIRWSAQKKNLELLELFNDTVLEIKTDLTNILNKGKKLPISFGDEPVDIQPLIIDDKSIKSITLNLRYLFQYQDCSLERIKTVYESLDIHENYKKMFLEMKKTADDYLKEYSEMFDQLTVSYTRYTRWEIIETFVYGQYAHKKTKLRKRIDLWYKNIAKIGFYQTIFFKSILMYIGILLLIRDFNNGVILNFGTDNMVIKDFGLSIENFDFKRLIKE